LAPHHSLVGSANVLLANLGRGGLLAQGFGFAQSTSSGGGGEIGYHYWWYWRRELRGLFFGPSLLLGTTTQATVGDASSAQAYWGVAVDVGEQAVFSSGVTLGAGAGLGFVRMAGVEAVFPRTLLQVGWSL
jgi:hypothetical protein